MTTMHLGYEVGVVAPSSLLAGGIESPLRYADDLVVFLAERGEPGQPVALEFLPRLWRRAPLRFQWPPLTPFIRSFQREASLLITWPTPSYVSSATTSTYLSPG